MPYLQYPSSKKMSQKSKLIINCGTTQVSAGLFSVSGGRLVLESFDVRDLEYDFGMPEAWLSALNAALKSMRLSGKANVIVPTANILTKTITVPHVDDVAMRDEVVEFEARKNIPYDLSEVTWGYQVIADDGIEAEVLLVSMKTGVADDICLSVSMGGLSTANLEPSSILDYNAWKYCGLEDNVMILNIGAKASNLIIVRGDSDFFVRSVPIGGNAITQSISDNLGKSFMQAESIKRKVLADAAEMASNDAVAEIIKNGVITVSKRISTELKRSILSYKRKGAATPQKLYLTGRGALTTGLAEYLCEELKADVQFLDVLSNLTVSPSVNGEKLKDASVHLSELVGEAARMVLPSSVGINLLPRHIVEESAFKRKMPLLFLGAALLAAAVVPPFIALQESIKFNDAKFREFNSRIPALEQDAVALAEKRDAANVLVDKIADLDILAKSKSNWINLFAEFEKSLFEEKDVWLDDLKVIRTKTKDGKPDYRLQFSGRLLLKDVGDDNTYDAKAALEKIKALLSKFEKSSFIEKIDDISTDNTNPRILKFNFTSVVKSDKPI